MAETPYSAMTITRWFIAWSDETGEDQEGPVSNLKLQKLLYYAQGHYLAANGRPLFTEPIQAWSHGPVVTSIYSAFKVFGRREILVDQDEDFSWDDVDEETTQFLIQVWNTYGQYAAWRLRNMTHDEPPWREVWDPDSKNLVIPMDAIAAYFRTTVGAAS